MFVCRHENPILFEAVTEVNIMDIQACKQTYIHIYNTKYFIPPYKNNLHRIVME